MADIDLELLGDFTEEAREHLDDMEKNLLQLADKAHQTETLNAIFTNIHTIKGAAQFVGLKQVSQLSHKIEDLLDLLRNEKIKVNDTIVEFLISARDRLVTLANELDATHTESSDIDDLMELAEFLLAQQSADEIDDDLAIEVAVETVAQNTDDLAEVATEVNLLEDLLPQISQLLSQCEQALTELSADCENNEILLSMVSLMQEIHAHAERCELEQTISLTTHVLSLLDIIVNGKKTVDIALVNLLLECLSRLHNLIEELQNFQLEATPVDDLLELLHQWQNSVASDANDASEAEDKQNMVQSELDTDLLDDFMLEANEHLLEMENHLLVLTEDLNNTHEVNSIFTNIHTIKGAAQFVGLQSIALLSHKTEDLLDILRQENVIVDADTPELLIEVKDRLTQLIIDLATDQQEKTDVTDLIEKIDSMISIDQEITQSDKETNEVETISETDFDLDSEDFQEEHDQELFDIFVNQLTEKVNLIEIQMQNVIPSGQTEGVTKICSEALKALLSSANYMGYEKLTKFYQGWLKQLHDIENGAQTDWQFMSSMMSQLQKAFPVLTDFSQQSASNTAHQPIPDTITSDVIEEIDDNNLFSQLSQALDQTLDHQENTDPESLHEMFDEMLDQTQPPIIPQNEPPIENKATTKPAIKERPPIKPPQPVQSNEKIAAKPNENVFKKSIRVDANKIDTLMNQVGELIVDRGFFHLLFNELRGLQYQLKEEIGLNQKELKKIRAFSFRFAEAIVALGRTSNDLQEGVMKVRMLPIAQLFNRYPRLIHDLIRDTDKKVNLQIKGEDTELDKMIIEEISDPLIHIIRNAIDHGIESRSERLASGKPENATLSLEAYHESNHIVIEISDNGRGIDLEKIKAKALANKLFRPEELARLSPREVMLLILLPGFSTAKEVSKTSGRGVGMDVVKKNIEKLNGVLDINSKLGKGTTFSLKIPLTLAIIRALQVRVGDNYFTIPLSNVEETLRIHSSETTTMEGTKVIHLRGRTMPIFWLSELFSITMDESSHEKFFVVVVNTGIQQIGLVVDELQGQEEVVIKPMVDYLQKQSGFAGATIIGDGRISLILDIYSLVKMTMHKQIEKHQAQDLQHKQLETND